MIRGHRQDGNPCELAAHQSHPAKGKAAGGEFRMSPKYGPYFLWPESLLP